MIIACSEDQRDLNSHQQRGLLSLLQPLAGENTPGRRTALPDRGSGPLLAPVSMAGYSSERLKGGGRQGFWGANLGKDGKGFGSKNLVTSLNCPKFQPQFCHGTDL